MSSREEPLRQLTDAIAACGVRPPEAEYERLGLDRHTRAALDAATEAILAFRRDGHHGQARAMAREVAERLADRVPEPEPTGPDLDNLSPSELAGLVPRRPRGMR